MKVMVVGKEERTRGLLEALTADRRWALTHCVSADEAKRTLRAASPPFDFILVEPDSAEGAEQWLDAPAGRDIHGAPVIFLERFGFAQAGGEHHGRYGFYPVKIMAEESRADGEDQWIFEYHAPCRPGQTDQGR
ncbi:MAG: hypothetical protein PVH31_05360 [Ectothiorhodospiraceae bacterium]|jgi:hypothetical protein